MPAESRSQTLSLSFGLVWVGLSKSMADEVFEATSGHARSEEEQRHTDPIVQDIKRAEPPVNVPLPAETETVAEQDRKNMGTSANAAALKESKSTAGPAPNFFQATLHKMFHLDASDKSKSSWSSATSESDEDHAPALAQRPRFQKLADGSHVHNLVPTRKVHRMHNLLRDFGLHVGGAADVPQRLREHNHGRPSFKLYDSDTTLTNKYGKCHKVIGKGAFGVVRIAHKTEPKVPGEKLFAVKEFKKLGNESMKKYLKRLTSEFCISSSLHHVNVIDTLDLLQDTQGNYCEVMEYCAGGDLYSLIIASGGLPQDEADCFFGQLINGVKYLHDVGVAHRDLKPENLLLTEDGCLKITDFGNGECFRMAWETKAHLSHGVCGSEPYIAPEVFTRDSFDPRPCDVWACGIIYMGMLTGRLMWRAAKSPEDNNYRAFLEARGRGSTVSVIRGLGLTRCNIMSQIIEPNPKHRMTVEQITQHRWFLSLNNCHTSLSPVTMQHGSCSAVSGQVPAIAEGSAAVHV